MNATLHLEVRYIQMTSQETDSVQHDWPVSKDAPFRPIDSDSTVQVRADCKTYDLRDISPGDMGLLGNEVSWIYEQTAAAEQCVVATIWARG